MSLSRTDNSGFVTWWWTVDRVAFIAMMALIAVGLLLAFAASPAETGKALQAGNFTFAAKQVVFALLALGILFGASLLSPRGVRLAAIWIFAAAALGTALTLVLGSEVLGARRWIDLGPSMTLQPSEFLKPGFAVLAAAILADKARMALPKEVLTFAILLPVLAVLMLQPDIGQTGLLLALWAALLFFNGAPLKWIGTIAGGGLALIALTYIAFPHVHHRIDQFIFPDQTGYQVRLALTAFRHGGLAGVGPGAGTIKYHIPYAHSDFIFAVAGEEFGFALCAAIALLFCVLSVRLLMRAARMPDAFSQLAGAGLAIVVGLQAFINMAVALGMLPAKGMTLPFISYGGSSLFAVALTMGFAIAITRQRSTIGERDSSLFAFLGGARA